MKMNPKQVLHRRSIRGAVNVTAIVISLLVVVATFVILRAFLSTAKEATTDVSERNQKVIESRKALVKEQTERLKNLRDSQATP